MAVLNPPRVLPGLGRSIINFLIENRSTWDEAQLVEAFKPPGLNEGQAATDGVNNTVSAFRAIGMLENGADGCLTVASSVAKRGPYFGRAAFRRVMLTHVLDLSRDGDPWSLDDGEASTSGARDLTRALSWFLAQDALGVPLNWVDNIQTLQAEQFPTTEHHTNKHHGWAITNDTRWSAFSRWAPALGLAVPSVVRSKDGLVPLPTVAISDAIDEMPCTRMLIQEFLDALTQKLPVLPGGVIHNGLVTRFGGDSDSGIRTKGFGTSVPQVLRLLEARGQVSFESLDDAEGVQLSQSDEKRTTHIILMDGKR